MTSDFFLEEAGPWRQEAWDIMRQRSGVIFYLPTKRPRRVESCLPPDWGDGRESISFNVTCENQRRTDERIPILLSLPVRHKGICAAPMIGPVEIDNYLAAGQIEEVRCGGENYDGCRPCRYEWVKALSGQCRKRNITFCFCKTGTVFYKGNRRYCSPDKKVQSQQAFCSGLSHEGKQAKLILSDELGRKIPESELYVCFTLSVVKNAVAACGAAAVPIAENAKRQDGRNNMNENSLIEKIHKSFTTQAAGFETDKMNFTKQEYLDDTVRSIGLPEADRVREAASGTCACRRAVASHVHQVTCVDAAPAMLAAGRAAAEKDRLSNIQFTEGLAEPAEAPSAPDRRLFGLLNAMRNAPACQTGCFDRRNARLPPGSRAFWQRLRPAGAATHIAGY